MKKYILLIIQKLSKAIIDKYRPFIIGITGTVGKTTTTHFVYEFLHSIHGDDVYISPYHYNGEYGVPMTIFMTRTPGSSPIAWIETLAHAASFLIFQKKYPKYLVLEYGIDHVGEMDFMLDIAKPDISILLNISRNHAMQFPNFDDYIAEKLKLADGSKKIIANLDDEVLTSALKGLKKEKMTYGVKKSSGDVSAKDIKAGIEKLDMTLIYDSKEYPLTYNVIGEFQTYNILPVFALGIMLGIEIEQIENVLAGVYPPSGRGVILHGAKDAIIIDGSYNGGFSSIT
jgi:UDP-N-acetylmuramoyl-tripeptide--D-alanyl-D-alanine ligase